MSTQQPSSFPGSPPRAGMPGLVAGAIIGLQGFGCALLAVFFPLVAAEGASLSNTSHVMFSVLTFLFAASLLLVARGLWQGAGWPRTATVVWLVLLLPVGWAMLQAGAVGFGALLLGSALVGIVAVAAEGRRASREHGR